MEPGTGLLGCAPAKELAQIYWGCQDSTQGKETDVLTLRRSPAAALAPQDTVPALSALLYHIAPRQHRTGPYMRVSDRIRGFKDFEGHFLLTTVGLSEYIFHNLYSLEFTFPLFPFLLHISSLFLSSLTLRRPPGFFQHPQD